MNQLERDQNNFKDSKTNLLSIKDNTNSLSYKKTNKLITALYMVTDIMEKDEPIRSKLRTLGVEILSDINSKNLTHSIKDTDQKVQEILLLLSIAEDMNFISSMNSNILKKEFGELKIALLEYKESSSFFGTKSTLSEFFIEEDNAEEIQQKTKIQNTKSIGEYSLRHLNPTRIGVQKGSTFMQALSDRIAVRPREENTRPIDRVNRPINKFASPIKQMSVTKTKEDFELLKKQRQEEILKIVKQSPDGASITDIRSKGKEIFSTTSEKTLQRELVNMVSVGVLKKTGSKRWSKYFLSTT